MGSFSRMSMIIFSNAWGVRCGSLPLDLLSAEFSKLLRNESPSLSDPGEFDNDGTSSFEGKGMSMAGTMVFSGWGGQHNVSRAQTLQLRFSSLLPSWMVFAHLEKTLRSLSARPGREKLGLVTYQSTSQINSPHFWDLFRACEQHRVARPGRATFLVAVVPACGPFPTVGATQ